MSEIIAFRPPAATAARGQANPCSPTPSIAEKAVRLHEARPRVAAFIERLIDDQLAKIDDDEDDGA